MSDQISRPDLEVVRPILTFVDLIAFSGNSDATRRRFRAATGISLSRMGIDTIDALTDGAHSVGALATVLDVDLTQVSRQIAALRAAGLVQKTRSVDDRRSVDIALTEYGLDALRSWNASYQEQMRQPLDTWQVEEVETFEEFLTTTVERLEPFLVRQGSSEPLLRDRATRIAVRTSPTRTAVDRCLDAIVALVDLVGRAHFDSALRSAGVPLTELEYLVLNDIHALAPTTVGQVTERLDRAQSAVSRAVLTLETDHLIRRTPDRDRRVRSLTSTEKGAKTIEHIRSSRLTDLVAVYADVPTPTFSRYAELTDTYLRELLVDADTAARRYL
ncbi:MarR family transcriptional regulator [Rhodococcus sovatensis]|uniref:MarR family transcriptional regulator n=1 Tax=Rhodococcus sovatensis TaxID=1805840 RepID=A0ABZ2PHV2_9NOCA